LAIASDSDFLFVTDAFNCPEACFGTALETGFTLDADADLDTARTPAVSFFFVVVLVKGLAAAFALVPLLALATDALTGDLPARALVITSLTGVEADLVASGFVFFAEGIWVFAGFFIAFAIESTTCYRGLNDGAHRQKNAASCRRRHQKREFLLSRSP
jgi:hypothetical protein